MTELNPVESPLFEELEMQQTWTQKEKDVENTRNDNLTEVIDGRVGVYGDPVEGHERIAQVWSGILGTPVTAAQVTLCMMGLKLVRADAAPNYADNSDDIEGYLDIFRQVVGSDMIQARSTSEFAVLDLGQMPANPGRW